MAAEPAGERVVEPAELREVVGEPLPRAWAKEIDRLDDHCRAFIAHSPLLVVATADAAGRADASPRGGPAGFVRVLDEHRLAWGELPSNRRADSMRNVLENPGIGLLFLVPAYDETLRVNGRAAISRDPALREAVALDGRVPALAVEVSVEVCYLQCGKALRRGRIWSSEDWPELDGLAPPAQIFRDHRDDGSTVADVQATMDESYTERVWWR